MRYSPVLALSNLVAIAGYVFTFLAAVAAAVIAMYGDRKRRTLSTSGTA
jgi:hypothetical protein